MFQSPSNKFPFISPGDSVLLYLLSKNRFYYAVFSKLHSKSLHEYAFKTNKMFFENHGFVLDVYKKNRLKIQQVFFGYSFKKIFKT